MTKGTSIYEVKAGDTALIGQISEWYFDEWLIPKEKTIQRLTKGAVDDFIFQLTVKVEQKPIATGGLYKNVGLLIDQPRFRKYGPWIGLLYTIRSERNKGIGEYLLQNIESRANEAGYSEVYLYTFTAERLYKRMGWLELERVIYKGQDTVVMKKNIKQAHNKIMQSSSNH